MPKAVTKRKPGYIRKRGADNLMSHQRHLLNALAETGDVDEAAKTAGVEMRQVTYWLRTDPAFRKRYSNLFDDVSLQKTNLRRISEKSVARIEEAHDAKRIISTEATCPECGNHFKVYSTQDDWQTRMDAAKVTLKTAGLLDDKKKVEVGGTVTVLTMAETLALAQIKAGHPERVSLQVVRALLGKGEITQDEVDNDVIEGESREV